MNVCLGGCVLAWSQVGKAPVRKILEEIYSIDLNIYTNLLMV